MCDEQSRKNLCSNEVSGQFDLPPCLSCLRICGSPSLIAACTSAEIDEAAPGTVEAFIVIGVLLTGISFVATSWTLLTLGVGSFLLDPCPKKPFLKPLPMDVVTAFVFSFTIDNFSALASLCAAIINSIIDGSSETGGLATFHSSATTDSPSLISSTSLPPDWRPELTVRRLARKSSFIAVFIPCSCNVQMQK